MWQLQFWWALIELPVLVRTWTIAYFLALVSLTLLLFVSAALVLPPNELADDESLRSTFERDGRWSLLSLSAYFSLAAVVDWNFWHVPPLSKEGALLLPLIDLPLFFLCSTSRRAQNIITLLYIPLSVWAVSVLSPSSYS
jgi:hypothetical protein